MEEARTLHLRPLIAIAAAVAVGLTMWATGAFAAGGSSPSNSPTDNPPGLIQDGDGGEGRSKEDCPEDRGGSGGSGDAGEPESAL